MLRKGVPSTFNNVKSLYSDPAKRNTIEQLAESYREEKPQMNGDASHTDMSDRWEKSVLYFLAQHYNFYLTRDLKKAMTYTDRLIELDPKTYDWHMNKARIYKHLGQPTEAAKQMNVARELDLRDRWINCKCAKYQLRDNHNDNALKTMSKFTRNEVMGGTLGDLTEMQGLWYLTEDAEAYIRQSRYGLALKRLHTIFNIFETWQEDQFDFHTFSLRKAQIRAYIDMLRWEDGLRSHPYYTRAALDAIRVYLALHDNPKLASHADLPLSLDVTQSHDQKAIKKAKQDEDKALANLREADRKAAAKKANLGQDGEVKKTDGDPKGLELANTKAPLQDAIKFLTPLIEFGEQDSEVQKTAFEVFIRRKKFFLALKHLLVAFKVDEKEPSLHPLAVRFWSEVSKAGDEVPSQVVELASKNLPERYQSGKDLSSINGAFIKGYETSVRHASAYVKAARVIKPEQPADVKIVVEALGKDKNLTLQHIEDAVTTIRDCGGSIVEASKVAKKGAEVLGYGSELLERAARSAR